MFNAIISYHVIAWGLCVCAITIPWKEAAVDVSDDGSVPRAPAQRHHQLLRPHAISKGSDVDPDPDSESGSGSRGIK